jgi:general secretion pathway protein K
MKPTLPIDDAPKIRRRIGAIRKVGESGGALLAVLWLTAALSAIAFSVATTVRGETERTATSSDALRAYYLATGAIERAKLYMLWGSQFRNPDGTPKFWEPGLSRLNFNFPSGVVTVEIIPESSKLNINYALPQEIAQLLANLGISPDRVSELTSAILDWRTPAPPGSSPFDQFYLTQSPSFHARHASLEEIEELLLVKGMTPELFYGTWTRDGQGRLVPIGGLKNCVSIYAVPNNVDVNTAEPAVLATLGINPDAVNAILERRHASPFRNISEVQTFAASGGPGMGKLRVGGGSIYTLRATAQLRTPTGQISDLRRSVSAMLKFREPGHSPQIETLRWYDN